MKTETENLRELDAWIAEHVMGQAKMFGLKKRGYWYRPDAHGYTDRQSEAWRLSLEEAKKHEYKRGYEPVLVCELDTPRFSTDPAAAMRVLEKCAEKLGSMEWIGISWDDGQWKVRIVHSPWEDFTDDTLPLAICKLSKQLFSK